MRRIIAELAGHISTHGAKTGSRRARRSAPARLVDPVDAVSCLIPSQFRFFKLLVVSLRTCPWALSH
jgi:hypothetical protein